MYRASTLPAMVEARAGHNGKLSNIISTIAEVRSQNEKVKPNRLNVFYFFILTSYF
jgi:hypothetical protein